jgi:putative endonuclease
MSRFYVYILALTAGGCFVCGRDERSRAAALAAQGKGGAGVHEEPWRGDAYYYEEYSSILEAREREALVKRWRRAWKFDLIENVNPDWRDLADALVL